MEKMEIAFGITYRVFYTDDTGFKREKNLRLEGGDNILYFFYNTHTEKIEAIPKRVIDRMEEIK